MLVTFYKDQRLNCILPQLPLEKESAQTDNTEIILHGQRVIHQVYLKSKLFELYTCTNDLVGGNLPLPLHNQTFQTENSAKEVCIRCIMEMLRQFWLSQCRRLPWNPSRTPSGFLQLPWEKSLFPSSQTQPNERITWPETESHGNFAINVPETNPLGRLLHCFYFVTTQDGHFNLC